MSVLAKIPKVTLLKLRGTPIRMDATFVIIPLLLMNMFSSRTDGDYWLLVIAGSVGLFVSILLHELGHAFAGAYFGLKTSEIGIGGIFGYARINLKGAPRKHMIPILLAGPIANLLLFFAFWLATGALPHNELVYMARSPMQFPSAGSPVHVLSLLAVVNLLLFVTNLLPAYPLDGGKAAALLLTFVAPNQVAYLLVCMSGLVVAAGLYVLLAGSSIVLAVVCVWIFWVNLRGIISMWRQQNPKSQRTG